MRFCDYEQISALRLMMAVACKVLNEGDLLAQSSNSVIEFIQLQRATTPIF